MVIEQQVDGDAQVWRGVWQGGAGALWSVGGGVYVCYHLCDSKGSRPPPKRMNFWKRKRGEGNSIQKFTSQIFAIIDVTSVMNFGKIWIF